MDGPQRQDVGHRDAVIRKALDHQVEADDHEDHDRHHENHGRVAHACKPLFIGLPDEEVPDCKIEDGRDDEVEERVGTEEHPAPRLRLRPCSESKHPYELRGTRCEILERIAAGAAEQARPDACIRKEAHDSDRSHEECREGKELEEIASGPRCLYRRGRHCRCLPGNEKDSCHSHREGGKKPSREAFLRLQRHGEDSDAESDTDDDVREACRRPEPGRH